VVTVDEPAMVDSTGLTRNSVTGRRAMRVLRTARTEWNRESGRLAVARGLTDEQRALLRPAVRQWDTRGAVAWSSRLRYAAWPIFATVCAVILLVPVVAVMVFVPAARALTPADLLVAAATNLSMFGALSAGFFSWFGLSQLLPGREARLLRVLVWLGCLGAAFFAVIAVVAVAVGSADWPAMRFGLAAGFVAAVMIVVGRWAGLVIGSYVLAPWLYRVLGTVPPSRVVASRMWFLADRFEEAYSTWPQAATRRELLARINLASAHLERRMPRMMWFAGYRGPAHEEAVQHYRRAASFTRSLAWRVVDAADRSDFERIRLDLVDTSVALAGGDWTPIPPVEKLNRSSKVAVILRAFDHPCGPGCGSAAAAVPARPDIDRASPNNSPSGSIRCSSIESYSC
jgi:hypothetical protein